MFLRMIESAVPIQIEPGVKPAACRGDNVDAGRLACDKERRADETVFVIRKLVEIVFFCLHVRVAVRLAIHRSTEKQGTA